LNIGAHSIHMFDVDSSDIAVRDPFLALDPVGATRVLMRC